MPSQEVFAPAFDGPPGTILAGLPLSHLTLPTPYISEGLNYYDACAKHVRETFRASRIYIVASKSLATNTDRVDKLVSTIGPDKVVGVRKGISPHSPFSEILEVTQQCRDGDVDCLVTLGAGSITDACKMVVFVSYDRHERLDCADHYQALANGICTAEQLFQYSYESKTIPSDVKQPTVPLITIPTSLSGGEVGLEITNGEWGMESDELHD